MFASVIGPTVAGALIGAISWRAIFALFAVIAVIALGGSGWLPAASPSQPRDRKERPRTHLAGRDIVRGLRLTSVEIRGRWQTAQNNPRKARILMIVFPAASRMSHRSRDYNPMGAGTCYTCTVVQDPVDLAEETLL